MAFHFPLATVLRYRGVLEEREERMLQRILFELSQVQETLARIDTQIADSDASRCAAVFKHFAGHDLHASYGEVKRLQQSRKDLEVQSRKLEELRDRQFIAYAAARRDREMLTEMQGEKRSVYDSEMARSEQQTVDDNYIARRGRF
jgi:flagellar export protein FliJ